VVLEREAAGYRVRVGGAEHAANAAPRSGGLDVTVDGRRVAVDVWRSGDRLVLWSGGERLEVDVVDPRHVDVRATVHEGELVARLPGTVVKVAVAE
ncbi:hypothetical protein ACSTHX_00705, partial [Vibrio parahaemolyticus]